MIAVDTLKKGMPVARISRAMGIPRSSIYYNRIERKRRLMENVSLEDGISVQN